MAILTTLALLCTAFNLAVANYHNTMKNDSSICDTISTNSTNKVQCYCIKDHHEIDAIRSADCFITADNLRPDDKSWESFNILNKAHKLTLTNSRGISLKYIPTKALKETKALEKVDVKYGVIQRIESFAFANLTSLEELALRDNQIEVLEKNAFAHHPHLVTIGLDKNNIIEINRNVFVDLPALQKLYLTSNKITTLHDRAFLHLSNLKELEIDRNGLFSLNSETFSGLKNLHKLDLSSNSLEVIGDNTFLPLIELRFLNLEGNKIQMLDDRAFNGLWKLQSLSLARNKLANIDNVKIFEGLDALSSLNLRENQLRELKVEVVTSILNNFYGIASSLDVEGNNFPCDCHLDWFVSLMNKTQNKRLKVAIENLKCNPEPHIRDLYLKTEDTDKGTGPVFEDEEPQAQNTDYEYYDVSQLNGTLFYIDMRYLLNCTNPSRPVIPEIKVNHLPKTVKEITETVTQETKHTNKKASHATAKPKTATESKVNRVTNHGILDLSDIEMTTKAIETVKPMDEIQGHKVVQTNELPNHYTTSRLATVSAKPLGDRKTYDDREMAADEAKPDQLKAHRSVQDEVENNNLHGNHAQRNIGCVTILPIIVVFSLNF